VFGENSRQRGKTRKKNQEGFKIMSTTSKRSTNFLPLLHCILLVTKSYDQTPFLGTWFVVTIATIGHRVILTRTSNIGCVWIQEAKL
jgi:hypothetical protein